MKYFKKIDFLPILPLDVEFQKMIENNQLEWNRHNQICLNSAPGHTNNYYYGAASLEYDWDKETYLPDGTINVPKRDISLKEEYFTELCDVFKGTIFEEIYTELKKHYVLGRVRIMMSKPKTCLTWHVDPTPRLHYPLTTQEGCFMVIDDEVHHLKNKEWYFTNTTLPHTAFNASKKPRIHLVAVVLDKIIV